MAAETFDEMHTALAAHGYRDVPEHKGLTVGGRVYHRGHQWPGAHRGTGTVLAVMLKDPSSWARSWGRPDVELIVEYDRDHSLHGLADYHVHIAEPGSEGQPAAGGETP